MFRFLTKILLVVVFYLLVWLGGFLYFVHWVPLEEPDYAKLPSIDGIIVLTGGSNRIERALDILLEEHAGNLLITGVDERVELKDMLQAVNRAEHANPDMENPLSDRIDMGYSAQDTKGNAKEALAWMGANSYTSALVVTANYHLPRAMFEFRALMPDKTFIPYPVLPENVYADQWWHYPGTAKLLISEYHKLVVAYLRNVIERYRPIN
jgi:uncharacterized SAM-binding protein YcdF (DUF218 family)